MSVEDAGVSAGAGAADRSADALPSSTPVLLGATSKDLGNPKRRKPIYIDTDAGMDMELFCIPPHYRDSIQHVLIPHGLVLDRVQRVAQDIITDYPDSVPHLICVLKGGHEFFTDLTRFMRMEHQYSSRTRLPFTFDFARLKSYVGMESSGKVSIMLDGVEMEQLEGRDVVLVEDIVDTGLSMSRLVPTLRKYKPKSVRVCTLLEKRTARSCGFKADYVGFSVPDAFVIGYNMDYNEAFRELPHVCVINSVGIEKYKDTIV